MQVLPSDILSPRPRYSAACAFAAFAAFAAFVAFVAFVAFASACGPSTPPGAEPLAPYRSFGAFTDSIIGRVGSFTADDSTVLFYDHSRRQILQLHERGSTTTIGNPGEGPGDVGHVRALSLNDEHIIAIDVKKGSLLRWTRTGEPLRETPLLYHLPRHTWIGPIIALEDATLLDYPLGGNVIGPYSDDVARDTMALIYRLDSTGSVVSRFGRIVPPPDSSSEYFNLIWQIGSMARNGDSVIVLRFATAVLEVYSLSAPSPTPLTAIVLPSERPQWLGPPRGFGVAGATPVRDRPLLEAQTVAVGVDNRGDIYAVMRTMPPMRSKSIVPGERLVRVPSGSDSVEVVGPLDGVNTRTIHFRGDGQMLRHYMADPTGKSGFVIGEYDLRARQNGMAPNR